MAMGIRCCKDCVPPKRTATCHSTCKEYLKEKAQLEKDKKMAKANEAPNVTQFDFDKICYAGCGRNKRRY